MEHCDFEPGTGPRFRWLSGARIPHDFDLRRCGWILQEALAPSAGTVSVVQAGSLDSLGWMHVLGSIREELRRMVLVVGVDCTNQRSALLQFGFGDVIGRDMDIAELGARASRVAQHGHWLPRKRRLGDVLLLDLLAREAYSNGKPLNLNPREFALMWRLSDTPNHTVTKRELIADVWRMGFVPETNSIAVHMSRLRRKLQFVGLEGTIETATPGGYRLIVAEEAASEAGDNVLTTAASDVAATLETLKSSAAA